MKLGVAFKEYQLAQITDIDFFDSVLINLENLALLWNTHNQLSIKVESFETIFLFFVSSPKINRKRILCVKFWVWFFGSVENQKHSFKIEHCIYIYNLYASKTFAFLKFLQFLWVLFAGNSDLLNHLSTT